LLRDATPLAGLIAERGAETVWKTGIERLGFPPSWLPSVADALEIQAALNEKG
jgi:hypothetical protein